MAKKKKSKKFLGFFRLSWPTALFLGIALGIASQRHPQLKAYTDTFIEPFIHHQLASKQIYAKRNMEEIKKFIDFILQSQKDS